VFIEAPELGPDAENMERALALRPEVYEAWRGLITAAAVRSRPPERLRPNALT